MVYSRRQLQIATRDDLYRRRPAIAAICEDYDGHSPHLEITNDSDEDLTGVTIELRDPLIGYVPALSCLMDDDGRQTREVQLGGGLLAAESERLRVVPGDFGGEAILYARCIGADGSTWRRTVRVAIPRHTAND